MQAERKKRQKKSDEPAAARKRSLPVAAAESELI
jgi:hypothetical protein